MKPKIDIFVQSRKSFPPRLKKKIKYAAQKTLHLIPQAKLKNKIKTEKKCTISVAIIGPKESQTFNFQYRGKNRPTDVLAFSRMESSLDHFKFENRDLGDVLICWSVAKRQAMLYETSIEEELSRLTIHGILHLFGYDHELNLNEEKKMFRLQNKILKSL